LELITDEHDDGWELARWVVENVESPARRNELASILDEWSSFGDQVEGAPALQASGRVVIFGGHTRDPKKMTRRLFEGSDLEVRWKTCSKGQGDPREDDIREWMAYADAVVVIIGMVSHNVMKAVKLYAQKNHIPFITVEKATENRLRTVLNELFTPRVREGSTE
jgi:hypothetical protein